MKINSETPCIVSVETGDDGGVHVIVQVPTYSGWSKFRITTERDNDGDWRVYLPGPDGVTYLDADGHEVVNGIAYLGAPDCEVEA